MAVAQKVVFSQARALCPFVHTGYGDHISWDPVGIEILFPRGKWPERENVKLFTCLCKVPRKIILSYSYAPPIGLHGVVPRWGNHFYCACTSLVWPVFGFTVNLLQFVCKLQEHMNYINIFLTYFFLSCMPELVLLNIIHIFVPIQRWISNCLLWGRLW